MAVLKFKVLPICGRGRCRFSRRRASQQLSRNVGPSSRRYDSAPGRRLLNQIRDELRMGVSNIANNVQNVANAVSFLSSNPQLKGSGIDQRWLEVAQKYRTATSSLRVVALQGSQQITDVLDQATGFYRSGASPDEKKREIKALSEGVKKYIENSSIKITNFVNTCQHIIRLATDCLESKHGILRLDQGLKNGLEKAKGNAFALSERRISFGHGMDTVHEEGIVGIVETLSAFVGPSTHRELLRRTGKAEMPSVFQEPSLDREFTKIDIITTFTDVGRMLRDDIRDVQLQYKTYSKHNNLREYGGIFDLVLDLYKSYADALSSFGLTCAKGRTAIY
ncbi:hypothetical protein SCHPADRAFT_904169 [Schizopora paradoxa]|uniref:Uncharacterized protein n=1 Tax=Schizopora paradoxa TaxID=27342 RepID=A0A0H2RNK9_9AGAM|nr:hypothetical protein SCHPADRAFT_904169 [Schizopora paradoxa]